jgi:hypothetical protein
VWRCPAYFTLGKDWIKKAIEYYEYCKKWFATDKCKRYSYAFPQDSETKINQLLEDFREHTKDMTPEKMEKGYGVKYTKDIYEFECRRWKKEKARVLQYLKETIKMLKGHLK